MVAMERTRRELSVDDSPGACTLPVVEKVRLETSPRGLVYYLACCRGKKKVENKRG